MSWERRRGVLRAPIPPHGLDALLLRRPANFAWYAGGADNRVDHAGPRGVADILLTPETEYVLANSIEALRMRAERTPDIEAAGYPRHVGPKRLL